MKKLITCLLLLVATGASSIVLAVAAPTGVVVGPKNPDASARLQWNNDTAVTRWDIYLDGVRRYQVPSTQVLPDPSTGKVGYIMVLLPPKDIISITMKALEGNVESAFSAPPAILSGSDTPFIYVASTPNQAFTVTLNSGGGGSTVAQGVSGTSAWPVTGDVDAFTALPLTPKLLIMGGRTGANFAVPFAGAADGGIFTNFTKINGNNILEGSGPTGVGVIRTSPAIDVVQGVSLTAIASDLLVTQGNQKALGIAESITYDINEKTTEIRKGRPGKTWYSSENGGNVIDQVFIGYGIIYSVTIRGVDSSTSPPYVGLWDGLGSQASANKIDFGYSTDYQYLFPRGLEFEEGCLINFSGGLVGGNVTIEYAQ